MASVPFPTRPYSTGLGRAAGANTGNGGGGAFGSNVAASAHQQHQHQQQRERERERERVEQERLDRLGHNQIGDLSEEQREEVNEAVQYYLSIFQYLLYGKKRNIICCLKELSYCGLTANHFQHSISLRSSILIKTGT